MALNVAVTGLPEGRAIGAQAIIRRELAQWLAGDGLAVIAHRLHSGDWTLVVFDGVDVRTLPNGWSERVLHALREAPLG